MSSVAEITLEQPGVIAVSEMLRKRLGLMPGMSLVVEDATEGIRLRVKERPAHLQYESHVLVYSGEIINAETDSVLADREQRMVELLR